MSDIIMRLEEVILSRRGSDPKESYVASLFAGGAPRIAKKFGEETVETIIAALDEDDAGMTGEAADTVFHLLVLLAERGLTFADVEAELARREGLSGIAEKAAREE